MTVVVKIAPSMYFRRLQRLCPGKPFFAQVLSAGALAATGDVLCQKLIEKRERWDIWRTSRFALTTAIIIAPIQFHWFRFMERHINGAPKPNGAVKVPLRTGVKRVLIDQSVIAPFLTATFLFSINFMQYFSASYALQRTKCIYWDVLANNYKFWPFVQMVNLTVVPLHYRVVFLQFFAIFWNIFLSFKTNN